MKQKTEYKNRIQDRETEIERLRNQVRKNSIGKCEQLQFVLFAAYKYVFKRNIFAVNNKKLQHGKSD